MTDEIPAAPIERLNWVKEVDGKVAVSVTAFGQTMGLLFSAADAEALMDGLMGALPQQADEFPSIGISRDHPSEAEVERVDVEPSDRPGHELQYHFRTGDRQGVKIRVSLREAMRWQRRLQAQIAERLRQTRN